MLIAPFSVPQSYVPPSARSRDVPRRLMRPIRPPTKPVVSWLIGGLVVLLLVPAARGGAMLGATLPFWLVAAPLIDLAWIERRRIAQHATECLQNSGRRPAMARSVRGQRTARSAACSAARS
jgi:hypothetical protein